MNLSFRGLKNPSQRRALGFFCRKACRLIPALKRRGEIVLVFMSDLSIRKYNRRFLKRDSATDVIAFPNSEGGDVLISLDTAKRQARKGGYKAVQELALYALHGMLHLAGYDDHGKNARARMFAAQKRIFKRVAPRLAPPDHR